MLGGNVLGSAVLELAVDSSKFDKGLRDAEQESKGFGSRVGGVLGGIGKAAVAGATVAGAAITGVAVKGTMDFIAFEEQMNEVFTLLPGASKKTMDQMSRDVRDFSKEFGTLPNEVVPALYQAISAGVPEDNVFSFLEIAQKAAIGGVTGLETAVDGISSVVNAYGADVMDAANASDLMFTAVRLGKTDFEQLSGSLFQVIPTASALGVEFGDVTAALAAMTAQGTPTAVATTQLRQAFVELSKDGGQTSEIFKEIAGTTFKQFIAEGGNTADALNLLAEYAADTGVGINDLFGSVEAGNAALALTGGGAETFAENLEAMANSAGATDAAFSTMDQGIGRSIARIRASISVMFIDVGEKLAPMVASAADTIVDLMPAVGDAIGWVFDKMSDLAGLLEGPVTTAFGIVKTGFEGFIEIAGTVAGGIRDIWETFREGDGILDGLKNVFESIDWSGVATALWEGLTAAVSAAASTVANVATAIYNWVSDSLSAVNWSGLATAIGDGLRAAWDAVTSGVTSAASWVRNTLADVDWQGIGDTLGGHLSTAWGAVSSAKDSVSSWLRTSVDDADWDGVRDSINGGLETAFSGIEQVADSFQPLQDALDWISETAAPKIEDLGEAVSSRLLPTFDIMRDTAGDIVDVFRSELGPTVDQLRDTFESLQPIFSVIGETLKIVAGIVGVVLLGAFRGVWEFFSSTLPPALELAFSLFRTLLAVVEQVADGVTTMVAVVGALFRGDWRKAWDEMFGYVDRTVGRIIGVVSDLGSSVLGYIEGLVDGIIGFFRGLFNTLVGRSIIPDLRDRIIGIFTTIRDTPLRLIRELRDGVVDRITDMRDTVVTLVTRFRDTVRDRFNNIRDWLTDRTQTLRDNVVSRITNMRDTVVNFVTDLRDTVRNRFNNIRDWLTDRAQSLRDNVVTLITNMRDTVVTTITNLRDTARDRFNNLRDWLTSRVETLRDNVVGTIINMKDLTLGLFTDIRNEAGRLTTELRTRVMDRLNTLVDRVEGIRDRLKAAVLWPFEQARDGIKAIVESFGNNAIDVLNNVLGRLGSFINNVRGAVNWVANQLGLGDLIGAYTVPQVQRLHTGTQSWAGGPAILHDEEFVMLPKGARVVGKDESRAIMQGVDGPGFDHRDAGPEGMGSGILGGMGGGIWDSIKSKASSAWDSLTSFGRDIISRGASWALEQVMDRFDLSLGLPGIFRELGSAIAARIRSGIQSAIAAMIRDVEAEQPEDAPVSLGGWHRPTTGGISQGFGPAHPSIAHWYEGGIHRGIDIANRRGTRVNAANDGVVSGASWMGGYGNTVVLNHADNLQTLYAHLERFLVGFGNVVKGGQQIATMNNTGTSTGDHLHFELRRGGAAINPTGIVPFAKGGIINEPIQGIGLRTGTRYLMGEEGPEEIRPLNQRRGYQPLGGNDVNVSFSGPVTIQSQPGREPDAVLNDVAWATQTALRRRGLV